MTTINDISDLVRILEEHPDWRATVRNLLLSEDLLNLPQQLAQFIEATNENFRQVNEKFQQVDENFQEIREKFQQVHENFRQVNVRLNRMEGRQGNFEGRDYERRISNRAMLRARRRFGLNNPVIAMSQYIPHTPQFDRLLAQAMQSGAVGDDDLDDLFEADIIIADDDNRYVVFEVSLTVENDDIERAVRRAGVMSAISGSEAMAAVATASVPEPQQALAEQMNVTVFIIPNH